MINNLPPALILIIGAVLLPFLKGRLRQLYLVLLTGFVIINLLLLPEGTSWTYNFLNQELTLLRVDRLSKVFGYIFVIMAFAGTIYALHVSKAMEHMAALIYAGSSLGVVFAGDYLTLYAFWEVMAFSSVYLVLANKTKAAQTASFRYILVHLFGGLVLLAGIMLHVKTTGSIKFDYLGLNGLDSYLILIGFALNAAIPPLSAWLSDAYPEGTVTGTVFLSAFTTKTAVYTLARAFPGAEILIWAGVLMTLYGIVYAILENDMRRVLAYSIINQVGFMVAGIGIGTTMALNGATAHAFAHILYKALLMMCGGAVLLMTGRSKTTELGGLYKSMPITLLFCLVGAASISAFPLTGGFISKSMVITAAGEEKMTAIWLLLNLASAGVFLHAGIKFPYFVFFAKDSGLRPKEPPTNMLVGMGILAFLCIFVGVFPGLLYGILPYPVEYVPYTMAHVVNQLQLLMFSALAFFLLLPYLQRTKTVTLDTDWIYRQGGRRLVELAGTPLIHLNDSISVFFNQTLPRFLAWFGQNPPQAAKISVLTVIHAATGNSLIQERLAKEKSLYPADKLYPWSVGTAVSFVLLLFFIYLLNY